MTPETISRLRDMFAAHSSMSAIETPPTDEIEQASIELGVPFPDGYLQFLTEFGGGMIGAYPIFGLRPVSVFETHRWSVIDNTKSFRLSSLPGTEGWVVFSEDHAGNPIGFDSDGVIWIFDYDFGGKVRLSGSFENYVCSQCLKDA